DGGGGGWWGGGRDARDGSVPVLGGLVGRIGCWSREANVVGEGWQLSGLGGGQVGERRGGLARGGGVSERRPGENRDSDVEGVIAQRPPVAVAGVEGGRLAGPVGQHVRKKRRHHPRGMAVRI